MRLSALRLERYGPFEDLRLTLDPGRLNLICAPNGAGKSVLRTAFSDLLFGIGGKSPMGFRFNYAGMRLTAEAIGPDGAAFAFGRRKGHGNTLIDGAGAPSDSPALAALLGGTDREALERLFALDTERLRRGGEDLMQSGGLVAEALLSAGGLSHARAARQALEEAADDLAPLRKSAAKPFYAAADRFVQARRAAGEALLKPEAWERAEREIAEAEAALAEARGRAAAAQAASTRLQRLRRVRPIMVDLDAAAAWLAAHPDAPALPAALGPRLEEAAAQRAAAAEKLRAETARHAALAAALAAIPADPALLAEEAAIERLAEHAGAAAKALEDVPKLEAGLAQTRAQIGHKLRRLGAPGADPAALIPARALETRTRALIRDHGKHEGACRDAGRTRDELAQAIAARRAAPGPEAALADAALPGLMALADEIRAQGDPAAQAREAAARAAAAAAALGSALAEAPFWQGEAEALRALPLAAMPAFERAHAAVVAAEAAAHRHGEAAAQAAGRLVEARERLRGIVGETTVPDREAVAAARRQRQALWDLVARTAFGPAPDVAELAVLRGQPLALAYERAVAEADTIADRRADESALIAQAREAGRQLVVAEQADRAAAAARDAAVAAQGEAEAGWRALLPPCLPPSARLDDVRAFAAARQRVIERLEAAALAQAAAAALAARQAGWAARLRAALPESGAPDLAALLAQALRVLAVAADAEKARAARDAAIAELERQHQAAASACAAAEAARAAWREDWRAALGALGRPADEAPEATEDILRLLGELDGDLIEAARLAARIGAMAADTARFTADIAALAARAAPDAPAATDTAGALAVLRRLREEVAAARTRHTQRATLQAQLEQAARGVAQLAALVAARETELAAVLEAAGAPTREAAELRLAESAERDRHAALLADAEARLRREGDGIGVDALRAELAAVTPEAVAGALAAAAADAAAAQAALEQHAGAVARLRQALGAREAETAYTDAVAAQNEAAATAGRVLREALVARLAAGLLAAAMETVEKQGSPEMLRRIEAWFARLTQGAYPHVGAEETASGMVLSLVQAGFPHEPKRVDQLSEGTRDQLYLALRLAAIEAHPVALPFVADDILQTSDDARAAAALEALVALGGRTQVILLTHHRHVVELAGGLPEGAVNFVTF
jgi:uncharacterized protein YhaN